MKKNYVKIMLLSVVLLASNVADTYANLPDGKKKEKKTDASNTQERLPLLVFKEANQPMSFEVNSKNLIGKEITITAPKGFTVSPQVIPANASKQKVTVTLQSTKALTEGKIVLRSEDYRYYIKAMGYGTALPVKDIAGSPLVQNKPEFSQNFKPGKNGYTIEFKVKTNDEMQAFYPYFVDGQGYGFKAYITSDAFGIFNGGNKKDIQNPATASEEGGRGKFYNNDGLAHIYRFAVTPDNRAFIYRDGMPIDTVRINDFGTQPGFADGTGEVKENLLKNADFEGEYELLPNTEIANGIEGWDIVIGDRWNSEQIIKPEELDKTFDFNNHVFEIRPYKWSGSTWSDGILAQVVDVAPNETYTLSALVKGGISEKESRNTGKMVIREVQNTEKSNVTEITSNDWETYSADYTTSPDCNQLEISFSVGRGGWGNDITPVRVDNVKLTGMARTYTPKVGFNNSAELEYFTIDESGAYAPEPATIEISPEE